MLASVPNKIGFAVAFGMVISQYSAPARPSAELNDYEANQITSLQGRYKGWLALTRPKILPRGGCEFPDPLDVPASPEGWLQTPGKAPQTPHTRHRRLPW